MDNLKKIIAMTANELMNGDWVLVPILDRMEPDFIRFIQSREGTIVTNHGVERYISQCEPIPITPEILKKNGFKQGKGFEQRWYIAEVYDKRITFYHSNTCWSLKIDKGILPLLNNIYIHSVHELQHAIQLCGIEKEITI